MLVRLECGKGTFWDICCLANSLLESFKIAEVLQANYTNLSPGLRSIASLMCNFGDLLETLENSIHLEATGANAQHYIKEGISLALDQAYFTTHNTSKLIEELRDKYRSLTGISNLKITSNNMLGYYIEVSSSQLSKVPEHFKLRQSLVNASRFNSEELIKLESDILNCQAEIATLEHDFFCNLQNKILEYKDAILLTANCIAKIDVALSATLCAQEYNLVKPSITDDTHLDIENGRHLVVEQLSKEQFTPNCLNMNQKHLRLITGPNMAGKSTFLRQNALIIMMAQIGMFVPASSANIGIVDKLFSRIGASDDISSGHSTFMVEMIEAANILNNATDKSFIILDEVGRGTSTTDGLSIAQAILENIHNNIKARTLFTTHYHELSKASSHLEKLECYTMKVHETNDDVIFTHEIIKGAADKSYGLHVAELAGIPNKVIARAMQLNKTYSADKKEILTEDHTNDNFSIVEESLKKIDIDDLTAKQALDTLYKMKKML